MIPLTRHGWREMLIGTLVLVLTAWGLEIVWWPLALLVLPVFIWLIAFFRDPHRPIPTEQHVMVSPADGVVSDIGEVDEPLLGGRAIRVGIFLSVFNVHVNRAPCDGRVVAINYKKGKFVNAMRHGEASTDNESNTIVLAEPRGGLPVAVVKQIVGLIARRIICTVRVGDTLERGQRFGMIKFGSRTELTIPLRLKPQIRVAIGQKVHGGMDVIAILGEPIHTTEPAARDAEEFEPIVGRETPA